MASLPNSASALRYATVGTRTVVEVLFRETTSANGPIAPSDTNEADGWSVATGSHVEHPRQYYVHPKY